MDKCQRNKKYCFSEPQSVPNEEEASSEPHHLSKRTTKHHGIGIGTSCTVKGSYCSCHYCRCDMGLIHCVKHGATTFNSGIGIGKDNCS